MNAFSNTAGHQQHRSEASRDQLGRCCAIDLAADTLGRLGRHKHRSIERRRQAVGQHLSGHIDQQGILTQPADTLRAQGVLQTLERLLDGPAPVIPRQVQAQDALNMGGQREGAQTGVLGGCQHSAISADQTATLEQAQLALALNAIDQAVIERPQGGSKQLGAGLGQGAVRDQNASAQAGKEGVEFALDTATAKAEQCRQQRGQRQFARADKGIEVIGAAG